MLLNFHDFFSENRYFNLFFELVRLALNQQFYQVLGLLLAADFNLITPQQFREDIRSLRLLNS